MCKHYIFVSGEEEREKQGDRVKGDEEGRLKNSILACDVFECSFSFTNPSSFFPPLSVLLEAAY